MDGHYFKRSAKNQNQRQPKTKTKFPSKASYKYREQQSRCYFLDVELNIIMCIEGLLSLAVNESGTPFM